ncbi:MAG: hypothetical protein ABIS00_10975 [Gemmatimonadales bacterium]
MRIIRSLGIFLLSATPAAAQNRQTIKSVAFPEALVAETARLEFHVATPAHGSLDTQVRTAMQELTTKHRGARFIKLRVFANPADLATIRAKINGFIGNAHALPPVISLVGVAGFPDTAQRVAIEATISTNGTVNPYGLGFLAGVASPAGDRTIAGLARITREMTIPDSNVLRISCFYEQADQADSARAAISSTFPKAEALYVFSFAKSVKPLIECEAMARLANAPAQPVQYFNRAGITASPNYSQAAFVATPKVIFVASQEAGEPTDSAFTAVFEWMQAAVTPLGASLADIVLGDYYWLTPEARDISRTVRVRYSGGTVPAATGVFFAGLASGSTGAGIDVVVAVR